MSIYIFQLILVVILGAILSRNNFTDKNKKIFLYSTGFILIFILTFRGITVGEDTGRYFEFYEQTKNISLEHLLNTDYRIDDVGYKIYNWIFSQINTPFWIILFINASISIVPVLLYIYKNAKDIIYSTYLYLALYFYAMNFNGMRQFMALGLFLLGLELLKKRKWYATVSYILIILLASTIHKTALIFLVGVLFIIIKPHFKNMIWIASLITIISIILYIWPEIVYNLISSIAPSYFERYAYNPAHAGIYPIGKSVLLQIFSVILYISAVFIVKQYNHKVEYIYNNSANSVLSGKSHKKNNISFNENDIFTLFVSSIMVLIAVAIYFVSRKFIPIWRFEGYFNTFLIILIPSIVHFFDDRLKLNDRARKIFVIALYAIPFLYFIYLLVIGRQGIIPYEFFWSN